MAGPGTDKWPREDTGDDLDEPGLADYLSWLEQDHRSGTYTPGTIASLGLVLGELRHHQGVLAQAGTTGSGG